MIIFDRHICVVGMHHTDIPKQIQDATSGIIINNTKFTTRKSLHLGPVKNTVHVHVAYSCDSDEHIPLLKQYDDKRIHILGYQNTSNICIHRNVLSVPMYMRHAYDAVILIGEFKTNRDAVSEL